MIAVLRTLCLISCAIAISDWIAYYDSLDSYSKGESRTTSWIILAAEVPLAAKESFQSYLCNFYGMNFFTNDNMRK